MKPLLLTIAAVLAAACVGVIVVMYQASLAKPATTQQPKAATPAPRVQLSLFASGLPRITSIVASGAVGDQRLYVLDQDGIINIVDQTGTVAAQPFLDIRQLVQSGGEMGLLGLAFSPHYAKDGYFFVDYIDKSRNTILARYHANGSIGDPASTVTLLKVPQPYTNHKAGSLAFGPDGYLYVALGDGGNGGDPGNRAQNLGVLLGKLLRLDVSSVPYKIPVANPFVSRPGALPEIWDLGLRNPWRFSFDRATGWLYIADVGQEKHEEINVESAGDRGGNNYGWRCYEGLDSYNPASCTAKTNYVFPVTAYDHTDGRCSITGGYVYRGSRYPSLTGKYFYADYCGGQLYALQHTSSGRWQSALVTKTPFNISTFGEGNNGELYLGDRITNAIYSLQTTAN